MSHDQVIPSHTLLVVLFTDRPTTHIYTLFLHDALPISSSMHPSRTGYTSGRLETQAPRCCRRSEEHTSELQSLRQLVCRLLLEKKKERHSLVVKQSKGLGVYPAGSGR